jgi:hypothetical protein
MSIFQRLFGTTTIAPSQSSDISAFRSFNNQHLSPTLDELYNNLQALYVSLDTKRGEVPLVTWQNIFQNTLKLSDHRLNLEQKKSELVNLPVKEYAQSLSQILPEIESSVRIILKKTEYVKGFRLLAVEERNNLLSHIQETKETISKTKDSWQTFQEKY